MQNNIEPNVIHDYECSILGKVDLD